jgi:hypothetical protein
LQEVASKDDKTEVTVTVKDGNGALVQGVVSSYKAIGGVIVINGLTAAHVPKASAQTVQLEVSPVENHSITNIVTFTLAMVAVPNAAVPNDKNGRADVASNGTNVSAAAAAQLQDAESMRVGLSVAAVLIACACCTFFALAMTRKKDGKKEGAVQPPVGGKDDTVTIMAVNSDNDSVSSVQFVYRETLYTVAWAAEPGSVIVTLVTGLICRIDTVEPYVGGLVVLKDGNGSFANPEKPDSSQGKPDMQQPADAIDLNIEI